MFTRIGISVLKRYHPATLFELAIIDSFRRCNRHHFVLDRYRCDCTTKLLKKEVARGGERTRVLSISFIFSFFTTLPLSHSGSPCTTKLSALQRHLTLISLLICNIKKMREKAETCIYL
jgi:hypothetical protein